MTLEGKPAWQIILSGATIPGIIIVAFAFIGAVYAVMVSADILNFAKNGMAIGVFFTLFFGLDIIVSIFAFSEKFKTNLLLALGYALVWAVSIYIFLKD